MFFNFSKVSKPPGQKNKQTTTTTKKLENLLENIIRSFVVVAGLSHTVPCSIRLERITLNLRVYRVVDDPGSRRYRLREQ